jgi:proteic killer suppression protein
VARKYIQRIQLLQAAESLDELLHLPGLDCHPLKGDRAGRYAVKLTGSVRLLFTLKGDKLDIIRIEEVSKHYGD